jgi:hypothetical protein
MRPALLIGTGLATLVAFAAPAHAAPRPCEPAAAEAATPCEPTPCLQSASLPCDR